MATGRIYTRQGDGGQTGLVGGQRVAKDDLRIEAYGTVDEVNAVIGWCRAELDAGAPPGLDEALARVQHVLFNVGSALATLPADRTPMMPRATAADVSALEAAMDEASGTLPALRHFILPGGSRLNAALHVARTVCRRAERLVAALHRETGDGVEELRYLNRLSDALFVWARQAAQALGHDEVAWRPQ